MHGLGEGHRDAQARETARPDGDVNLVDVLGRVTVSPQEALDGGEDLGAVLHRAGEGRLFEESISARERHRPDPAGSLDRQNDRLLAWTSQIITMLHLVTLRAVSVSHF